MSTEQAENQTKLSRRSLLQVMGAGAVASLAPGAASASGSALSESSLGGAPQSALSVSGVLANLLQEEKAHAHVFVLKFGEDSQQWPTLRVNAANADDPAVELRTSLGAVTILTGTTPRERLRITKNGKVGIGTADPGHALHVDGSSVYFTGDLSVDGVTTTGALQLAGDGKVSGENGISFFIQDAPRLTVTAAGNVGIGTSTPTAKLHLQVKDNEALRIENTSLAKSARMGVDALGVWIEPEENDSSIRLNANPGLTGLFVKGSDGKVGIGTTDPGHALHVVGNVQIDGTLSATKTISPLNWQAVELQQGWEYYGSPFNPAEYSKDEHGVVHLRGLVRRGQAGPQATVFVLPEGYRPEHQELHVVCTRSIEPSTMGRIDITTDGRLIPYVVDNRWFSLDGITFQAAPVQPNIPGDPQVPVENPPLTR